MPNQKLLHSGHNKGLLTYGILATKLRTDKNISEKLYIYDTLSDIMTKHNRSKNIGISYTNINTYWLL